MVQDEAEETRAVLAAKVPAQVDPAATTQGKTPVEPWKPGVLGAGRAHNHAADRLGEATDVIEKPGRVHETVLVGALHGHAVAGRGHHEAAGTAQDGWFRFRAGGRFGAVVGLLGTVRPRLLFAKTRLQALHVEQPTIGDLQVAVKSRPLTREAIVRHTSKLLGMFLVGSLFAVGCGPSELELKVASLDKALKEQQDENAKLKGQNGDLTKKLAEANAAADKFKAWGTGTQADKEALQKKLAELEKAKAASEAREAMFKSLAEKLHAMVDAGQSRLRFATAACCWFCPTTSSLIPARSS